MRAPLRWRAKRAYAGRGKWGEREGGKAGSGAFPLSHCTEPGRRSGIDARITRGTCAARARERDVFGGAPFVSSGSAQTDIAFYLWFFVK